MARRRRRARNCSRAAALRLGAVLLGVDPCCRALRNSMTDVADRLDAAIRRSCRNRAGGSGCRAQRDVAAHGCVRVRSVTQRVRDRPDVLRRQRRRLSPRRDQPLGRIRRTCPHRRSDRYRSDCCGRAGRRRDAPPSPPGDYWLPHFKCRVRPLLRRLSGELAELTWALLADGRPVFGERTA